MRRTDGIDLLARLEALEQIRVLKARYCRYVDTKDWSEFARLFTDQAVLCFPENFQSADATDSGCLIAFGSLGCISRSNCSPARSFERPSRPLCNF
jgi:hypothetical protein